MSPADDLLDVKLGQMLMVGFRGTTAEECRGFLDRIRRCHLGGVWLTDNDSPMGRTHGNIHSPAQLKALIADLQASAAIPLLVAIDAEGGQVIRLRQKYGFPPFPSAQALGERDDLSFTRSQAALLASTLRQAGVNLNLAPVVDLNTRPDNPVIGRRARSFSADPAVVSRHAVEFITSHHQRGVLCGLKHFPGHGSATADSHVGIADVTEGWSPEELLPYREIVARGLADVVISGHLMLRHVDHQYPATLSSSIIRGILREQIGFGGVVISDDLNMGAIRKYYSPEETIERAVSAGVDVLLHGNVDHYDEQITERTVDILRRLVKTGRISRERIDASFRRITALKRQCGLSQR